jgi:segregation and condensation protein A
MHKQYQVRLEKFEGPLDLLLQLIEKEELNITEISLAKVTNQFLKYLNEIEKINPESLADFLVVAAQLILIKSKALLPKLALPEEDELSSEELARRLQEYKIFKDKSRELNKIYRDKCASFERQFQEETVAFYPGKNLSLNSLTNAILSLTEELNKFKALAQKTIKQTISIKMKINYLQEMISKELKIKFKSVLQKAKTKLEAVVSFLALLELVKQQIIKVEQDKTFGEIIVEKQQGS